MNNDFRIFNHYKILKYLDDYKRYPKKNYPSKIAKEMKCCTTSLTGWVNRLEELELLTSNIIGKNRYLKITDKGKEMVERFEKIGEYLQGEKIIELKA